jgi:hypothetical protein
MPEKFVFKDKVLEFEKFEPEGQYRRAVVQPSKRPGSYVSHATVFVNKDVYNVEIRPHCRAKTPTMDPKLKEKLTTELQVGLTDCLLSIGIPIGTYVPLKWNKYKNMYEIFLEDLQNDQLILNDKLASEENKQY